MQKILNEELYAYLTEILILLSDEKSSTNIIDSLAVSALNNATKAKFCPSCKRQNFENQKKLSRLQNTIANIFKIQKEKIVEVKNNMNEQLANNSLIFKQYRIDDEQVTVCTPRISLTQRIAEQDVNIPEIYISDLINLNPNSVANVKQVLLHIEKISGIKDKIRKWIVVVCDGVPYHYATKLKEKFPWLV
ncbi:hypothetical protein F8M41_015251 [Gigaspora margarita]|uniref:Uncharacterized protein n=1 Tax=Gigaspora margarita TaxID=4874 RepID=A0A8H3WVP6_GIGMA|nr:hypothetical protein F8M41_015251 [Gigaspora margarita]